MTDSKELETRHSTEVERQADSGRKSVRPRSAIWSEDGEVVLTLEMPGVGQANLSVHVENDVLRIHGTREPRAERSEFIMRERIDADWAAAFTLDETIDRNKTAGERPARVRAITDRRGSGGCRHPAAGMAGSSTRDASDGPGCRRPRIAVHYIWFFIYRKRGHPFPGLATRRRSCYG